MLTVLSRPATRHEALLWYRNGGREELEEDSARLANCGNYKQYHLMTRWEGGWGRQP